MTTADFMVVDLKKKKVIFHPKAVRKRRINKDFKYSWSSAFTPEELEEKWVYKESRKLLGKNAVAIVKRLEKHVGVYFDIYDRKNSN